jgi:hypothetical protein
VPCSLQCFTDRGLQIIFSGEEQDVHNRPWMRHSPQDVNRPKRTRACNHDPIRPYRSPLQRS